MFLCPNCKRFQDDSPAFVYTDNTLKDQNPVDCKVICCSCGYNKYILRGYVNNGYRLKGRFEDMGNKEIPTVISDLLYDGGKPMR